jgi:hypothetical protein
VSLDAYHHLLGGAIAAGAVVGAVIALVNSWRV